jgi:hypothetical protein
MSVSRRRCKEGKERNGKGHFHNASFSTLTVDTRRRQGGRRERRDERGGATLSMWPSQPAGRSSRKIQSQLFPRLSLPFPYFLERSWRCRRRYLSCWRRCSHRQHGAVASAASAGKSDRRRRPTPPLLAASEDSFPPPRWVTNGRKGFGDRRISLTSSAAVAGGVRSVYSVQDGRFSGRGAPLLCFGHPMKGRERMRGGGGGGEL